MKIKNWTTKSILTGIIVGLLSMIYITDFRVFILVAIVVTALMLIFNPKRRFLRWLSIAFTTFIGFNKLTLWIAGKLFGVSFILEFTALDWTVSIALLLLCGLFAILDHLERTEKKYNLFGFINITINKVNGNNNTTHISEGANVTYITVEGDYVVKDDKRQNINEIDEVKKLLKREEELQILINSSTENDQINEYQNELTEVKTKAEYTKSEIINLSKTINLLSSKYPEEANKASQLLMNGFYGSAKDYFIHLQEERQDKKLAEKIGIEYNELLELEHWVEQGHTSKDGMIYYYNIWFSGDSPEEIINKIDGVEKLGDSYCLEVSPWFFDEPEPEEDYEEDYREENN